MSVEEKEKIVGRIVVQKEGGKDEAGNLAHCVSLIKADQSRLNTKLELMKNEMKHEIKTQIKSIKQKNFQNQKQIFCYYCATYQDSVHYCTNKNVILIMTETTK